jgi:hypothetical protein
MKALALAALLALSVNATAAETVPDINTGNGFLALCESQSECERGMCLDYVTELSIGYDIGMIFGNQILHDGAGQPLYCTPEGVTLGQKVDVVVAYLEENPSRRHERTSALALTAFKKAWPCKE